MNILQHVDQGTLRETFFPVDLIPMSLSEASSSDTKEILSLSETSCDLYRSGHPLTIVRYAFTCWNDYCQTGDAHARKEFLVQVGWFVENAVQIGSEASGWPIAFSRSHEKDGELCLSTTIQSCAIALLRRTFILTHEQNLLSLLGRALATFEQDILDGGINAPVGEGIFFEERGVYPASHRLTSCLFALYCLYDYELLSGHTPVNSLIQCAFVALHKLLPEFDTGFWTYSDLLHRRLSTFNEFALQVKLLAALPHTAQCAYCTSVIERWKHYQTRPAFRRSVVACWTRCRDTIGYFIQARFFPRSISSSPLRVCVEVPAFPVLGGVLTVLEGIAQVTKDIWQIDYVTNHVGRQAEAYVIHRFGKKKTGYWQFPMVWIYVIAGCRKLLLLMHRRSAYQLILSQDGIFTGAFAALAGKLAGARVVCIDHGHLTLLNSKSYRTERVEILQGRAWYRRVISRFLYLFYWPSLSLLAHITARLTDCFLVPGIAGDGVEEVCKGLSVPVSRLVRFASMIDAENHPVLDATIKEELRRSKNLPSDAFIIAIACRLAPEKGLDIAFASISHALTQVPSQQKVAVVIAGDGPLRQQLADDVKRLGLGQICTFWGDISQQEVSALLGISDIFLYTSIRGACFPMAVLEAMASGCAVIASTQPAANAHLLGDGRGIAVRAGDVEQTSIALTTLILDPSLCRAVGELARKYIQTYHSPEAFRRTLLRTTHWSGLNELLQPETML